MFIIPDWKQAQWYPLIEQFDTVHHYPIGSEIFTCPSTSTYNAADSRHAAAEGGHDRVFAQGTPVACYCGDQ